MLYLHGLMKNNQDLMIRITSNKVHIPVIPSDIKKGWDEYTIKLKSIESVDLMECASKIFVENLIPLIEKKEMKVGILAGNGNNGGDGIAIGRLLANEGYQVYIFLDERSSKRSSDNLEQIKKLPNNDSICLKDVSELIAWIEGFEIGDSIIIIDGIFGAGFKGDLKSPWKEAVQWLNSQKNHQIKIYAIDIPSGCEYEAPKAGLILKADCTICFESPPLASFFPSTGPFFGNLICTSIGLLDEYLSSVDVQYFILTSNFIKKILPIRSRFTHKGSFGKVFIWGGSDGMPGAGILNVIGAQSTGVGYVYYYSTSQILNQLIMGQSPETICTREFSMVRNCNALAIGSGIGTSNGHNNLLNTISANSEKLKVLDADALTMIAEDGEVEKWLNRYTIITPHPIEFDRLFGPHDSFLDRLRTQKKVSKETGCTIVLKGAYSSISNQKGQIYFNPTGNDAMARAGSGDVLTGIIAGLLAQNIDPFHAATIGVYIHGLAAEIAVKDCSSRSVSPSIVAQFIGKAFKLVEDVS
jgi:hydroxyethylthiazole kinase-like uncharacterized protein yjeF